MFDSSGLAVNLHFKRIFCVVNALPGILRIDLCTGFPLHKLLHRYGLWVSFGGIAANAPPSAQRSDTDERFAV